MHSTNSTLNAIALGLSVLLGGCSVDTMPPANLPAARADIPVPDALPGWRTWAINRVLEGRVDWQGARSGFVVLVARNGHLIHSASVGHQDVEAEIPMTVETRFQIASMTKPVIAVAAMILVEEGILDLDDPITKYLPSFSSVEIAEFDAQGNVSGTHPPENPILLRHVLSFTSGRGPGMDKSSLAKRWQEEGIYHGEGSLTERIERLPALPLFFEPGTEWRYGNSMDVVARIVEIASRQPLEQFLEARIFRRLGMDATYYYKDMPENEPLATMYFLDDKGDLVPADQTHIPDDWTPGGFGLVSTAPDYMRFALMLWNNGVYNGVRILKKASVERMQTFEIESGVLTNAGIEGLGFGLGVAVVADQEKTTRTTRTGDFSWSGAYGTHFWVSPSTGITLVVMQQQFMPPGSGELPIVPALVQALALTDE